jgi:Rod binding domain-containing protein
MKPLAIESVGQPTVTQRAPSPEALKAAREFESLLLRHVLKSLEKTTKIGPPAAGGSSSTYRSMMVDALADGISQAGGLGLADLIARSLDGPAFRPVDQNAQALVEPAVHTDEANPGLAALPLEDK